MNRIRIYPNVEVSRFVSFRRVPIRVPKSALFGIF